VFVHPPLPGLEFHHAGVACDDLDLDESLFCALGYRRERPECVDPIQGVRARFLVGGGPRIELVCSLEGRGVLSDWLRKGTKFYHVAYEVDDLQSAAPAFEALGAKLVVEPVPGAAFGMRLLCFYMLPNLVLVELISRS
jgi:methylmalonyl-CoA/ethylmalonyl-CoA epimerase